MMKKDNSPYVPQRDKLRQKLAIREKIPWTEKQQRFIQLALAKNTKIILCKSPAGTGKAQPIDALILTPSGFKKMGDLQLGEFVSIPNGKSAPIIGIYPQGEKDVYQISFSDGTKTECCLDHLWFTQTEKERHHRKKEDRKRYKTPKIGQIRTTLEIQQSLLSSRGTKNHCIPITQPIQFADEHQNLKIHPYLLGVLLGDGCIKYSTPKITTADKEIIEKIKTVLPISCFVSQQQEIEYSIPSVEGYRLGNPLTKALKEYSLYGLDSSMKFIPDDFKFTSLENRLELLKGLMDTDGSVNRHSSYFYSTSKKLADDVRFLVESLGGICFLNIRKPFFEYKGEKKQGKDCYVLTVVLPAHINPFFLPRKANAVIPKTKYSPQRYIVEIKKTRKAECQCILIDSPEHLYLTNNCIVTHNTSLAVYCSLMKLLEKKVGEIVYIRAPIESCSKGIGYLQGGKDEKMSPYLEPAMDHLRTFLDEASIRHLVQEGRIKIEPFGFIKGRTFNVSSIIMDEAEDLSIQELELIMTRIGKFSTIFLLGDVRQSNIRNSGFDKVFRAFNSEKLQNAGIYTFEFTKEDCVRNEITALILDTFEGIS